MVRQIVIVRRAVTSMVYPVVRSADVVANIFFPGNFITGTQTPLPALLVKKLENGMLPSARVGLPRRHCGRNLTPLSPNRNDIYDATTELPNRATH
jgi:hypothetical protein